MIVRNRLDSLVLVIRNNYCNCIIFIADLMSKFNLSHIFQSWLVGGLFGLDNCNTSA